MTYTIFDTTGNLVEVFTDRAIALNSLAGIVQADPDTADDFYLVAQDDTGNMVGGTVYASSVSAHGAAGVTTRLLP